MTNTLIVTTPSECEIVITRVFNAPRNLVFDCWTKPELLRRWMLGPEDWIFAVCEIDLKVGGKYRFVWRNSEGNEMGMGGVYREDCDIAEPTAVGSPEARVRGVDAHAIDGTAATRLWALSATLTGVNAFA